MPLLPGMSQPERLAAVFQHALAVAAEDGKQLGPIHLLKYAYLADVAHAQKNAGQSFTQVPWRFYHFGPWSGEAFEHIPTALAAVSAREFRFASQYSSEDAVRFELDREHATKVLEQTETRLPWSVSNTLAREVREHGADTKSLLRHVYITGPMLAARPGEVLDLSVGLRPVSSIDGEPERKLTRAQKRHRAAIIDTARSTVQKRLAALRQQRRVDPSPAPRFDDVFYEGVAQLDRLAGDKPTSSTGEVEFDDSIWHSSLRREPDLP